jgi:CheY-like chemotaxis protein/DNA-binding XRE family transcriptional regulator
MTKANVRKEFGAAVRAHRLRLGLSQESLAERAALHRTYVTDVERGARNLSLESISRLAGALDLSISSLFSSPSPPRAARAGGAPGSQTEAVIVLVEDDPKDIELTLSAFAAARVDNPVEVLRDGAAALDLLLCRGGYADRRELPQPLVVLLDLQLPKLHGLEVLQRLREAEKAHRQRVVVLTHSRQNSEVREALRLGAEAFIVKPLNFEAFSSITPSLNFSWMLQPPRRPPLPAVSCADAPEAAEG